jgi:hypothetical protein
MGEPVRPRPNCSLWWYAPIVLVVVLGYALGGALSYGTAFLAWFGVVSDPSGRVCLELFGMGMLGASLYCSRWWSVDYDDAQGDARLWPAPLDWFGYATTIIGGGITGVVLYLVVRYGVALVTGAAGAAVLPGAAVVIALMGGLFHFKVQALLEELFRKVRAQATAPADQEAKGTDTEPSP